MPRPVWALAALVSCFSCGSLLGIDLTDYGAVPPLAKPAQDQSAANEKLDFHTDLFTGRFAYSIPIRVPPARQGTEPSISLQYNSSAKNGWCGVGWDLDMGYIQRETRNGVPTSAGSYSDAFGFTFSAAGQSGRLIKITSTDYRPQINSAFLKFAFSNGWWTITDKSGRKYLFGETTASRVTNSYGSFKWALSSIRDPNGNKTLLSYTNYLSQLYLQRIDYNGNDNSPAIATNCTVAFDLETSDRADISSSLIAGAEVQTARRLSKVRVLAGNNLVRRYQLAYTNSPSTGRSLLQSVTEYGRDNTTSLPPHTFTYSVQGNSFQPAADWSIVSQGATVPIGVCPGTPDAQLLDINGDGLPDWVTRPEGGDNTSWSVQFNNGSSFGSSQAWSPVANEDSYTDPYWGALDSCLLDFQNQKHPITTLADINGDLLPDRVMRQSASPYSHFQVQLNTGIGFSSVSDWSGVENNNTGVSADLGCAPSGTTWDGKITLASLVDINGDGLPDRVLCSSTDGQFDVQINHNGYFGSITSWGNVGAAANATGPLAYAPRGRDPGHVYSELMDMNGDGLPDRVIPDYVQLNNGVSQFGPTLDWGFSGDPEALSVSDGCYTTQFLDINGDGLPDRVVKTSGSTYTVYFNTGRRFSSSAVTWTGVDGVDGGTGTTGWDGLQAFDDYGTKVTFADLNGDGLPDRIKRNYAGTTAKLLVQLNTGPFPDLLSTASNGIGGSVSVAYTNSTSYNNSDGTRPRLPMVLYTVASVTTSDGRGNDSTTTYNYTNGLYDTVWREFRGFGIVRVTDPLGAYTVTWFHQGGGTNGSPIGEYNDSLAKAGMAYRTETFGNDGLRYTRTLHKVDQVLLHTNGVYFPFVRQTIKQDIETNAVTGQYRATAVGYAYNAISNNLASSTCNLIGETNFGEVASVIISNQTFSTGVAGAPPPVYKQYSYATIASNADILDRVAVANVTADGAGTSILKQTTNQYFGITGDLKVKADRICPGSYAVTTFGYDVYGNQTSVTNPVGLISTTDYDSATATYPVRKYSASLGDNLIEYSLYDARSGQLVAATNMQGLVTSNGFDVFFRITNSVISTNPYGPPALTRLKYEYKLAGMADAFSTNYVRVFQNNPADPSGFHEIWTYLDGLGRVIQTRVEAETNNFRVSNVWYDDRGQPFLQSYPVFGATSNYGKPVGITRTNLYTEFDAIGRPFRINPCASATFDGNGNLLTITTLSGDTGSPVGPTSWAFQDGTNVWAIIVTNPRGNTRKFYLDAFGRTNRIIEVTSQGSYTNLLLYDTVGNLTNLTDSAGNKISFFYNDLGEKVAEGDPDRGFWQFGLDAAGRLRSQIDSKSNTIIFDYSDPLDRLTARLSYNPSNVLTAALTNHYDNNAGDAVYSVFPGQLYLMTDSEGWEKFSYDFRNRNLTKVRYLSKNGQTYTNQFTYDDADRALTMTYPNGGPTISNIFDTGMHLSQVKQVGSAGTTFYLSRGFNELEQLIGINFGNGVQTTNAYYPTSRRLKQIVTLKTTNIQSLTYSFDANGNSTKITDGVYSGSASGTAGNIQYDDLDRLTSLTNTSGTFAFAYDRVGNITTNGEFGAGGYAYGTIRPHFVRSANGAWYTADQNGNVVFRNGQRLDYNADNQLYRVIATNGLVTMFGYSGTGERLWKLTSTNMLQVWLDGTYEEKNGQILYHILADGRTACTFDSTETNVFEYSHPDNITSTSVQTDQNGNPIQHYTYFAFGQSRYSQSSTAFPPSRRYTSQVLDDDTGLYYYNFRYYDPTLARFLQPDDIIPDISNPQSWNRYAYCVNNPLRFTDPSGHLPKWMYSLAPDWLASWMYPSGVGPTYMTPAGQLLNGPPNTAPPMSLMGMQREELGGYDPTDVHGIAGAAKAAIDLFPPKAAVDGGYTTFTGRNADTDQKVQRGDVIQAVGATAATLLPTLGMAKDAAAIDHIVIGIRAEGLEKTAVKIGARHLLKDPNWRETLLKAIQSPNSKFTISLDGFSGGTTYSQLMGAAQRGATPAAKATEWEISQLYQAGRLSEATLMKGGEVVANPMTP